MILLLKLSQLRQTESLGWNFSDWDWCSVKYILGPYLTEKNSM